MEAVSKHEGSRCSGAVQAGGRAARRRRGAEACLNVEASMQLTCVLLEEPLEVIQVDHVLKADLLALALVGAGVWVDAAGRGGVGGRARQSMLAADRQAHSATPGVHIPGLSLAPRQLRPACTGAACCRPHPPPPPLTCSTWAAPSGPG